jgi:hypothetical protein
MFILLKLFIFKFLIDCITTQEFLNKKKNGENSELIMLNKRQLQEVSTTPSCTTDSDCLHGSCQAGVCVCEKYFITNPPDSYPQCNYELKKQMTAFLYELFLGFGAGHFYCERSLIAALKLVSFIFGILVICLFPITAKYISERTDSDTMVIVVSCFYYICALGLAFWFTYDLVMFGLNKYKDGYGFDLISWDQD